MSVIFYAFIVWIEYYLLFITGMVVFDGGMGGRVLVTALRDPPHWS